MDDRVELFATVPTKVASFEATKEKGLWCECATNSSRLGMVTDSDPTEIETSSNSSDARDAEASRTLVAGLPVRHVRCVTLVPHPGGE